MGQIWLQYGDFILPIILGLIAYGMLQVVWNTLMDLIDICVGENRYDG